MKRAEIYFIEDNKEINIPSFNKDIIMTSGGYDPIHPGHISYLIDAKNKANEFGENIHVAVVNGDWFLSQKKGKPFIPLNDRCEIVSALYCVDIVIGLNIINDMTVNKALKIIKPKYFAKGGDRTNIENIPEWQTCQELGIKILTEIGLGKKWSSSDYLSKWKNL